MSTSARSYLLLIALLLASLILLNCGSTPSQFYVLSAAPEAGHSYTSTQENLVLGIEKIDLPDYLTQPQIVTRLSNNELHRNEKHRWAEPLDDNIENVLRQNITAFIPNAQVLDYPWRKSDHVGVRLHVEVSRFDTDAQGESHLIARWQLKREHDSALLISQQKHYMLIAPSRDYQTMTQTMNANLTALSHDITRDIQRYSGQSFVK